MKVIVARDIELRNSNVAEDTSPVWDSGTTYNTDDIVRVENLGNNGITKLYKSLTDDNVGNYPPDNPDKWQDLGATNRWRMFDEYVGTQTENDTSIDVTVRVHKVDYIALFEIDANELTIEVYEVDEGGAQGDLLWSTTQSLIVTDSTSWSEYFFDDITYQRSWSQNLNQVITLVPVYNLNIDIRVVLSKPSGTVKCGMMYCGYSYGLGNTLWNPRVSILDYSRKMTDSWGRTYLAQGAWAKKIEFALEVPTRDIDRVMRILAELRATPCVWEVNTKGTDFDSLRVYGFYKDFEIIVAGAILSKCSLTVEGLI